LFDEPFSNLDAALRMKTRGEIKELHQRLGVTSVFVTHDQEEALSLSDHIAVMRAGKVEQYGTPEEVYSHPATKYVARFIGSPQIDIFVGQFERQGEALCYRIGEFSIPLPAGLHLPSVELDMGVRPEHILLGESGFPSIVRLVQPVGPYTYVTVVWEGGSATARQSGISALRPRDSISVSFDTSGLLFFDRSSEKLV
jgi:ABC-type sugar transport system ATPase subunit